MADHPRGNPGINVCGQHGQYLAEGQVWIAQAGIGVAVTAADDEIGTSVLRPLDKCLDQGCFPLARLTGDKDRPALSDQCLLQIAVQLPQLALAGNKDRSFGASRFLSAGKGKLLDRDVRVTHQ